MHHLSVCTYAEQNYSSLQVSYKVELIGSEVSINTLYSAKNLTILSCEEQIENSFAVGEGILFCIFCEYVGFKHYHIILGYFAKVFKPLYLRFTKDIA